VLWVILHVKAIGSKGGGVFYFCEGCVKRKVGEEKGNFDVYEKA
jgi:hypothetical protein